MTTDVKTIEADWPVDRVAQFLIDHKISGVPVVDGEELVGVISLTDLARHNGTSGNPVRERPLAYYRHELESQYSEGDLETLRVTEGPEDTTAQHVMTPQVYDVNPYTSVQQVAQVMYQGGIHRVFVTEDGEIQGIITALDMLKLVASL